MQAYVVTGRMIEIHTGVLELSNAQAVRRSHNLKRTSKKGKRYEVLNPVQFKQGEEFGYDGDLPKRLNHLVKNMNDVQAEADAKAEAIAKAEADAKAEAIAKAEADAKAEAIAKAATEDIDPE